MKRCVPRHASRNARGVRLAPALAALIFCVCARPISAAESDHSRAEALIREHEYAQAYELLTSSEEIGTEDPAVAYLIGRAALGTNRADAAVEHLEKAIAARPEDVRARLALGRAYQALGRYADAKIEFDTVLRFTDLPQDIRSQTEIYSAAAERYLEEDTRFAWFDYIQTGVGHYHAQSGSEPDATGENQAFYLVELAGGLNYLLANGYSLDGNLSYEFRSYDSAQKRNDSDLAWRASVSRVLARGSISGGVRGLVSYVGDGDYRNDYGAFMD